MLQTSIAWNAHTWHQLALAWSSSETTLFVDGQTVAKTTGLILAPPPAAGVFGFCLGSDVNGGSLAQGEFEELATFGRPGTEGDLRRDYERNVALTALGPLTPEEEAKLREDAQNAPKGDAPSTRPPDRDALLASLSTCASELFVERGSNAVTITITNATAATRFDVFRTFDVLGASVTNTFWHYVTNGTNGQRFTFPRTCPHFYYVLGCTNDTDADGLTDVFEALVTKTSPFTNHSVNALYTDLEMVNILVTDPEQDCNTEQNSQFETTCALLGTNVIVAYVDSNLGVYGLAINEPDTSPRWLYGFAG